MGDICCSSDGCRYFWRQVTGMNVTSGYRHWREWSRPGKMLDEKNIWLSYEIWSNGLLAFRDLGFYQYTEGSDNVNRTAAFRFCDGLLFHWSRNSLYYFFPFSLCLENIAMKGLDFLVIKIKFVCALKIEYGFSLIDDHEFFG